MHLLVIFVQFLCSWFACTVKVELRVTIIAVLNVYGLLIIHIDC